MKPYEYRDAAIEDVMDILRYDVDISAWAGDRRGLERHLVETLPYDTCVSSLRSPEIAHACLMNNAQTLAAAMLTYADREGIDAAMLILRNGSVACDGLIRSELRTDLAPEAIDLFEIELGCLIDEFDASRARGSLAAYMVQKYVLSGPRARDYAAELDILADDVGGVHHRELRHSIADVADRMSSEYAVEKVRAAAGGYLTSRQMREKFPRPIATVKAAADCVGTVDNRQLAAVLRGAASALRRSFSVRAYSENELYNTGMRSGGAAITPATERLRVRGPVDDSAA